MTRRKYMNNIIIILISQAIIKFSGFVYKIYLANKQGFGDNGNAIYNSGYQIFAFVLTITTIGVPSAISKLIAEKHNELKNKEVSEIFKSAIIIFSIIGISSGLLMFIFSSIIADKILNISEAKFSIIALCPAIFNVCIISIYRGVYNGINKIDIVMKSQSIEQILKAVFTFILVETAIILTKKNTIFMAAFANLATTFATLFSFIYLNKKNKIQYKKSKFKLSVAWKIIKLSIPISITSILASLNKNIDSITIIKFMSNTIGIDKTKIQFGIFSGKVEVIAGMPISLIIAIVSTLIPKLAKNKYDNKKIIKICLLYIKIIIIIILPFSLILFEHANIILKILFGNENGYLLLKVSSISLIFIALEQVINAILIGIGCEKIPAIALFIGIVIKYIVNILVIYTANIKNCFLWINGNELIRCMCKHIMLSYDSIFD